MVHCKNILYLVTILFVMVPNASAFDVNVNPHATEIEAGNCVTVNMLITYGGNSTPVSNTLVNVTTDVGWLIPSSLYTNTSGIAEFSINSTVAATAHINVSVDGGYNLTNVTFVPSDITSLLVESDSSVNTAGGITNISFYPVDKFGNVNSSENVELAVFINDTLGIPVNSTSLSIPVGSIALLEAARTGLDVSYAPGPSDRAVLQLNSTVAGDIFIESSVLSISNNSQLQILPDLPKIMNIYSNKECTVDTSGEFYLYLYDKYSNPIGQANVTFTITPPENTLSNSPVTYNSASVGTSSGFTSATGYIHNTFRTDKRAGENIITISVVNSSLQYNLAITGIAGDVDQFSLRHTPEKALANYIDTYTVSACLADQFQNPVVSPPKSVINNMVLFEIDGETLLIPVNNMGYANVKVGPTPYVESTLISATYRNEHGYTGFNNSTVVNFTYDELSELEVYAVPNVVLEQSIGGNHNSSITVVALDQWGHSLPDIDLTLYNTNTTVGTLTANGNSAKDIIDLTTDSRGRVYATFTGNISGNTSIVATGDNVSSSTNVSVINGPFMSVAVDVSPPSIQSGSIINVTTVVSIEGNLPLTRPAASTMLVLDRSGSMDPDYYAGTPIDVVLVLDRSGSMEGTPLSDAKKAAKEFANDLVSNSEIGIVSFSSSSRVDLGMTSMNSYNSKIPVYNAIDSIAAGGSTAMGEGMANANHLLVNGRADTKKVMIVLADGKTNSGDDRECSNAIDIANANDIAVYTISLGPSLDEPLLRHIAADTGGAYYHAPDSSDLSDIYKIIAQELSDFDISEVEYGTDGFTQYDYTFQDTLSHVSSDSFEDTFLINETINDLKVQLDWSDSSDDLHLQLTSPSGIVYSLNDNSTGYYPGDNSEYIWIQPLSYLYPESDSDNVETGYWTAKVTGSGIGSADFTITTYIDKKSAAKLSSHALISNFDGNTGDKAGLGLYSFEKVAPNASQTSYILDDSTWLGYFTPLSEADYTFKVSWDDGSPMDVYLYDGTEVVSSSSGIGSCEVSGVLSEYQTYYIEIAKGAGSGTDTRFTIDVTSTPLDMLMTAYYDGSETPKYRTWNGFEWSAEKSVGGVGSDPCQVRIEANPLSSEIIMATSDKDKDVNVQIWDGSSWGSVTQFSKHLESEDQRGFDIAYEQKSGDALLVYTDVEINDGVPRYRVWDGNSWSSDRAVDDDHQGIGDVNWVHLEADPFSDEIILVTLDDSSHLAAQVWDGDSWGHSLSLPFMASRTQNYQCFDVAYEQKTGRAVVCWADFDGFIKYRTWDGSSWSSRHNIYFPGVAVYWVKMAEDPNSNNLIMATEDHFHNIRVTTWNGNSWSSLHKIEGGFYWSDLYQYSKRSVDVAFEQSSGIGLVAWGSNDSTPKYCTWDGDSWSSISGTTSLADKGYQLWIQLTSIPGSDEIYLMAGDENDDLDIEVWDGDSWSIVTEVETSADKDFECFDITYHDMDEPATSTPVLWEGWTADVMSTLNNDSLSHLGTVIDAMTADGLTGIDEGLFVANNELSSVDGNSSIVIMTDGLDNAGYHSLLKEAQRAADNNITIYTVGLANDESEVDPILAQIANMTGGEYYFAPNSHELMSIFTGIGMQLVNYSALGPVMEIHVPYNYATPMSTGSAIYINGSSNSTSGNESGFMVPTGPARGNSEPVINSSTGERILSWQLPTMTSGDKWGIWYQMRVYGTGYMPIILPTSTITYMDVDSNNVTVNLPDTSGTTLGGSFASPSVPLLGSLDLEPDKHIVLIGDSTDIRVTVEYLSGDPASADVWLYSDVGYFGNKQNPVNFTVNGTGIIDFHSEVAARAHIEAYAYNVNNATDVLMAEDMIAVRPKGAITIS